MFQKYEVTPVKLGATYLIFVVCLISAETYDFYLSGHTVIRKSQCSGSVISYDSDFLISRYFCWLTL